MGLDGKSYSIRQRVIEDPDIPPDRKSHVVERYSVLAFFQRGIAEMEAAERQWCVTCGIERRAIYFEWVPMGYEIQSLECPACRTVMRMVRKRPALRRRVDNPKRSYRAP